VTLVHSGQGPHTHREADNPVVAPKFREGRFAILRGVGRVNGDGWKDSTKKGEVVFTYGRQLPRPYGAGQYERVGNICWTASIDQYDFRRARFWEVIPLIPAIIRDRKDRRLWAFRWEKYPKATTASSVGIAAGDEPKSPTQSEEAGQPTRATGTNDPSTEGGR
jgi:hypothetical protein